MPRALKVADQAVAVCDVRVLNALKRAQQSSGSTAVDPILFLHLDLLVQIRDMQPTRRDVPLRIGKRLLKRCPVHITKLINSRLPIPLGGVHSRLSVTADEAAPDGRSRQSARG